MNRSPTSLWAGLLALAGAAAATVVLTRLYGHALDAVPDLQLTEDDFALQPLAGANATS
jgi:hypothetical protein